MLTGSIAREHVESTYGSGGLRPFSIDGSAPLNHAAAHALNASLLGTLHSRRVAGSGVRRPHRPRHIRSPPHTSLWPPLDVAVFAAVADTGRDGDTAINHCALRKGCVPHPRQTWYPLSVAFSLVPPPPPHRSTFTQSTSTPPTQPPFLALAKVSVASPLSLFLSNSVHPRTHAHVTHVHANPQRTTQSQPLSLTCTCTGSHNYLHTHATLARTLAHLHMHTHALAPAIAH
jgi:hypothetical protein